MLTILLSLLACNAQKNLENDPDPNTVGQVPPMKTTANAGDVAGAGRIATRRTVGSSIAVTDSVAFKAPSGALVQDDCYGGSRRDYASPKGRPGSGGGFGLGAVSGGSAAPPPPSAPAAAAPMEVASRGEGAPRAEPTPTTSRPLAKPRPPMRQAAADGLADSAPAPVRIHTEAKESESQAVATMDEAEESRARRAPSDKDNEWDDSWAKAKTPEPVWEYGATVYLSNDDSMSLASAQRLLWAVDQNRPFSSGEVRPHELLNYFSFDTQPVAKGETFSVLGGAEREGDTLSVALAVHGTNPARQPLDLTLVIDRSGSMQQEGRMDYVRRGLTQMVDQLVSGDRVDLVLFDSSVCTPLQNFVVGRDSPELLKAEINRMAPRGATDLDGGLREGFRIQTARDASERHQRNQRVLLLTDAQLNSGNVNEGLVAEIGKRFETDGIRVTGVGVGRDFNDKMLNKITEKGKGAYVYLGSEAVVDRVFGSGFSSLVQTIAHDVQFSIELPDSLAMKKFYGEESSTNAEDVQPINYYAGTTQLFMQDLKIKPGALDGSAKVVFRAKFKDARTGEPTESTFETTVGALLEGDTHNLKKAQALMRWTDLLAARAMGDRNCSTLGDYRRAASQVQGDAEIAYVSGLTGKLCGVDMSQTMAATGVRFKVKVDADMPIPEVRLACSDDAYSDRLSGSDTVAAFENVVPGTCTLTLQGNVPMVASVEVPQSGGDVRCMVRGGRMSCD